MSGAVRLGGERQAEVCLPVPCLRRLYAVSTVSIAVFYSIGLLSAGAAAIAQPAKGLAGALPTLTTTHQAHSLTSEQAARAYPVHLRGVVTYFDPNFGYGNAAIFVHDSTGSVFVTTPSTNVGLLTAGTAIDVRGVSGHGTFGPIVTEPQIRVIGHAPLPANPPRVSLPHLKTGAEDAQWVEVEGTVHSVLVNGQTVTLQLAMVDGNISAILPREATAAYFSLVDAKVRIHANAAPIINSDSQMIGVHLMVPNLSAITIVEAAPGDPFRQPLTRIDRLLHWDQFSASFHRVHLRGNVTLQWPDSPLCIRDANRGICVQTVQDTRFALGDLVDIAGFAGTENDQPVLTDAVLRGAGKGAPVAAAPVSVEQALQGNHDSDLIQIDGQLIGDDMATSDLNLMLASGNTVFAAVLPKDLIGSEAAPWKIGSRLRVTGICSVQVDTRSHLREGVAVTKSFRVLMRSPKDVVVLQRPSWWTPAHALLLLALAFAVTLEVLVWVAVLRGRVQHQADLLRESEERFRHMALHDGLTGLATRLLLRDRLNTAVDAANRHKTGLALLMVDLDRFKETNDTFGHAAGDEVLRVTAKRLQEAVRKIDTVARIGGDEFVLLLTDLHDPHVAERVAAKVVAALAVPVPFGGQNMPISVSVGVCSAFAPELDAETLLKRADAALYRAKARGRNCFEIYVSELPAVPVEPATPGTP
jgi:diguanylate cyclase (GGDEF)-like protein